MKNTLIENALYPTCEYCGKEKTNCDFECLKNILLKFCEDLERLKQGTRDIKSLNYVVGYNDAINDVIEKIKGGQNG